MNTINFIPYSSTKFEINGNSLLVESPWLQIDAELDQDGQYLATQALAQLSNLDNESLNQDSYQFLKNFANYPLLHAVPRKVYSDNIYHSSSDLLDKSQGPRDLINSLNRFSEVDVDRDFYYIPKTWQWNYDELLETSRIADSEYYDPFSVYTKIREMRLEFQTKVGRRAQKLMEALRHQRKNDEKKFFENMVIVLSQQHYVTRMCDSCLGLAQKELKLISEEVRQYAKEEIAHDKLILNSIHILNKDAQVEKNYTPEVKLEIEVIKHAAQNCALSFSTLVSIMEGTVYPESDPVGNLLLDSSLPKSSYGVEAHFQINRKGNHTAIPEKFVAKLPPVTKKTVINAAKLSETTIELDSGLSITLYNELFVQ